MVFTREDGRHTGRACLLVCCALLCMIASSEAIAADGEFQGIGSVGRVFTGQPLDVELQGTIAFIGHDTGVETVDVSSVLAPASLDRLYLPGPAYDLFVSGAIVYAACGEAGLITIDATDPSSLSVLAVFPTSGTRGVWVQGTTAYLAEASNATLQTYGLRTVDVTDPSDPQAAGFLPMTNGATDVTVSGTLAYVGMGTEVAGTHGVAVVDVTDPLAPFQEGFLAAQWPVHDIALAGTRALVGTGLPSIGAVSAVDFSTPSSPAFLSSLSLTDGAKKLSLDGTVLAVAIGSSGLRLYDVSDLTALKETGAFDPVGDDADAVIMTGAMAYTGVRSYADVPPSFTIVSTSVPGSMQFQASLPYTDAVDVSAEPGLAYFLNRDGLQIFDAANPSLPAWLGAWTPAQANLTALDVRDGLAAIGEGAFVHLVDVVDPTTPSAKGTVLLQVGVAVKTILAGSTLYVVNGSGRGFESFDVTDPVSPSVLGSFASQGYGSDLCVRGATGYLASGNELVILDLALPGEPTVLGTYQAQEAIYAVEVVGDYAVLSGQGKTIMVLDIATPSAPALLSELPGDTGYELVLDGPYALVAAGEAGLIGVDISDPQSPAVAGFYDTSGAAVAIDAIAGTLYLATGPGQHWIFACAFCATTGCAVTPVIDPPGPIALCEGETQLLSGLDSVSSGCPEPLSFQWFKDGAILPGASFAFYTVPGTLPLGKTTYTLEASCAVVPGCFATQDVEVNVGQETWPTILYNSLKASRQPVDSTFAWILDTGSGEFNFHRTDVKSDIPDLYTDQSSIIGFTPATFLEVTDGPGVGQAAYYQVYGRGSCSGASIP